MKNKGVFGAKGTPGAYTNAKLSACQGLAAALAARRHWIVCVTCGYVHVYTVTEDNVKGKRGAAAAHSQL